jgi:hypothetical protein
MVITGKCACAKVQYQVSAELIDFSHCHCSICRKIHGAAFASWGGIARDKFTYLSGEDSIKSYAFSENSDSIFCSNCSSTLLVDYKPDKEMLYVAMGAVDGNVNCPPGFHGFVGSKAPWFEISDDLPQYNAAIDAD